MEVEGGKSPKKPRTSHSEIEKRRRDKMNQYISDLATMIPLPPTVKSKPDKLTVLRLTVEHMKALKGSTAPSTETNHKPAFISDDDLRNLITEASGGFFIVIQCEKFEVLYISESVQGTLNVAQADVINKNFCDMIHFHDVAKIKSHLCTTTTEELNNVSADESDVVWPGAKRSFLCQMKKGNGCKIEEDEKKSLQDTYVTVAFDGYMKSWPIQKKSKDPSAQCCLIAVGRALEIHNNDTDYSKPGVKKSFESRHEANSVFTRVDRSFSGILGYYPNEVVGKSPYQFCHKDDLQALANNHQEILSDGGSQKDLLFRLRAKDGRYIPLKTSHVAFRNPWSKEIDFMIAKNVVLTPIASHLVVIDETRSAEKSSMDPANQQDKLTEDIKDLLRQVENLDSNENKVRKRRVGSTEKKTTKPLSAGDVGVMIADKAKSVAEALKMKNQPTVQYSKNPVSKTNTQPYTNLGKDQNNYTESVINHQAPSTNPAGPYPSNQNEYTHNIMTHQIERIEEVIGVMEGSIETVEDDGLSSIMSMIENDDDLRTVLCDIAWNNV